MFPRVTVARCEAAREGRRARLGVPELTGGATRERACADEGRAGSLRAQRGARPPAFTDAERVSAFARGPARIEKRRAASAACSGRPSDLHRINPALNR